MLMSTCTLHVYAAHIWNLDSPMYRPTAGLEFNSNVNNSISDNGIAGPRVWNEFPLIIRYVECTDYIN